MGSADRESRLLTEPRRGPNSPRRRKQPRLLMTDEKFLKEDLVNLRKELGLTQQEMADRLDMALRGYQGIEAGESEYRYIQRLAAERGALAIAADKMAPRLPSA